MKHIMWNIIYNNPINVLMLIQEFILFEEFKGIKHWSKGGAMDENEMGWGVNLVLKITGCPEWKFELVTSLKGSVGLLTGELVIFKLFH